MLWFLAGAADHGGGLQNDAQGFGNGAHLFAFFFEQGATSFMESDPEAAQYFKWAARSMWKNMAVRDDFGSFYWTPVRTYPLRSTHLSYPQIIVQKTCAS